MARINANNTLNKVYNEFLFKLNLICYVFNVGYVVKRVQSVRRNIFARHIPTLFIILSCLIRILAIRWESEQHILYAKTQINQRTHRDLLILQ